ncbi:MAG: hypothetical protein IJC37_04660 [Clostridia bacterium]|nr:hypothetical protein [Clostridia bacterium]
MKRLLLLTLCIVMLLTSCSNQSDNTETQIDSLSYAVYGWNSIEHNNNTFQKYDKYGNYFSDYYIFDKLSDKTVSATYYSNGIESGKVELKPYLGNGQTNFISQDEHWYDLFEPSVYGNVDNPRFNYLDVYDNVDKMSILITSNDSTAYQCGEYLLPDNLSSDAWSILNKIENNSPDDDNSRWKKTDLEAWIYLYIKDVNAAAYVGILCYNENDELCISNTNYTELYPLSSQWQDLGLLIESCEYIQNSPLN